MKMPLNPNPLEARQPGSGVAPTEGAQGATGVGATAGDRRDLDISPPDPEVTEAKPRRRFTAAYKLRVIDQADQCSEARPDRCTAATRGVVFLSADQLAKAARAGHPPGPDAGKTRPQGKTSKSSRYPCGRIGARKSAPAKQTQTSPYYHRGSKKISEILGIEQNLQEIEESK